MWNCRITRYLEDSSAAVLVEMRSQGLNNGLSLLLSTLTLSRPNLLLVLAMLISHLLLVCCTSRSRCDMGSASRCDRGSASTSSRGRLLQVSVLPMGKRIICAILLHPILETVS